MTCLELSLLLFWGHRHGVFPSEANNISTVINFLVRLDASRTGADDP